MRSGATGGRNTKKRLRRTSGATSNTQHVAKEEENLRTKIIKKDLCDRSQRRYHPHRGLVQSSKAAPPPLSLPCKVPSRAKRGHRGRFFDDATLVVHRPEDRSHKQYVHDPMQSYTPLDWICASRLKRRNGRRRGMGLLPIPSYGSRGPKSLPSLSGHQEPGCPLVEASLSSLGISRVDRPDRSDLCPFFRWHQDPSHGSSLMSAASDLLIAINAEQVPRQDRKGAEAPSLGPGFLYHREVSHHLIRST